jgi:hypothetical protein
MKLMNRIGRRELGDEWDLMIKIKEQINGC